MGCYASEHIQVRCKYLLICSGITHVSGCVYSPASGKRANLIPFRGSFAAVWRKPHSCSFGEMCFQNMVNVSLTKLSPTDRLRMDL